MLVAVPRPKWTRGSLELLELAERLMQHLGVQEDQRVERLVLGRHGHVSLRGQMGEKSVHVADPQLSRVPPLLLPLCSLGGRGEGRGEVRVLSAKLQKLPHPVPLRQQLIQELVLRGCSPRTQEAYVSAVLQLARHYRRSPDKVSDQELKD